LKKPDEKRNDVNEYAKYSSISMQMIIIILLGVFGGRELDKLTQFKFPVFTVVLSISSVFLAMYIIIKDLLKPKNKNKN